MMVEIPCRIGDMVWAVRNYKGQKTPQQGFVSEIYFTDDMQLAIAVKYIGRGEWGKTVFATLEEAMASIREGK